MRPTPRSRAPRSRRALSRTITALALAALLLASITGCGGGSSKHGSAQQTSPSSQPNSHFIAQADAICKRLNEELTASAAKSAAAAEVMRIVPHHAAIERRALGELARLGPPSALSASWQAILADRRTLADGLEKLVAATRRNDQAAVKQVTASKKQAHAALTKAATGAGFKDCATVG